MEGKKRRKRGGRKKGLNKRTIAKAAAAVVVRKSFELFDRTGRADKTLRDCFDEDDLELLREIRRVSRRLKQGRLSSKELCRFIDRLVPDAE